MAQPKHLTQASLASFGIVSQMAAVDKPLVTDEHIQTILRAIREESLEQTLEEASTYAVQAVGKTRSQGSGVPYMSCKEVNSFMKQGPGSRCLCAGSLSSLDFAHKACRAIDVSRILFYLREYRTLLSLTRAVGTFQVNFDTIPDIEAHQSLKRTNNEAEMHALLLVLFWTKDPDLIEACRQLPFEYVHAGVGSKAITYSLQLLNEEEKKKRVMGISGWRRMIFYSDLATKVTIENRFPEIKNEAVKLLAVLKEDNVLENNLDDNTVKRYLSIGKRVMHHAKLLQMWEAFHERDSLLDQVSVLRAVFAAAESEEDAAYVLQELFLQQRAGIRTQLAGKTKKGEPRNASNIAKAILLKRSLFTYLRAEFPKLEADIDTYSGVGVYELLFNVMPDGTVGAGGGPGSDEEEAPQEVTSNVSKHKLCKFLQRVRKLSFDWQLCKMASCENFQPQRVDLTHPDATSIKNIINEIKEKYAQDFRPKSLQEDKVAHVTDDISVRLVAEDLSDDQYAAEKKAYDEAVKAHKRQVLDTYIHERVALVVDEGDQQKRKRKLEALAVCQEKRRKLVVKDFLCERKVDWDQLAKHHLTMFGPVKADVVTSEAVEDAYEIFNAVKADKASTDVLLFLVPGPPPNKPENKAVAIVHKQLRAFRMKPAKIGRIEVAGIPGQRSKVAFSGGTENFMVFSSDRNDLLNFKSGPMKFLSGDTLNNRWPVPAIPFAELSQCEKTEHEKIVGLDCENAPMEEQEEGETSNISKEEKEMADSKFVAPFPKEHSALLGMELINTFQTEVLICTDVGAGELIKAAISSQILFAGACKTVAHKAWVMQNLRAHIESRDLINLKTGAPEKHPSMIKYEQAKAPSTGALVAVPKPGSPAKSEELAKPSPGTSPPSGSTGGSGFLGGFGTAAF